MFAVYILRHWMTCSYWQSSCKHILIYWEIIYAYNYKRRGLLPRGPCPASEVRYEPPTTEHSCAVLETTFACLCATRRIGCKHSLPHLAILTMPLYEKSVIQILQKFITVVNSYPKTKLTLMQFFWATCRSDFLNTNMKSLRKIFRALFSILVLWKLSLCNTSKNWFWNWLMFYFL